MIDSAFMASLPMHRKMQPPVYRHIFLVISCFRRRSSTLWWIWVNLLTGASRTWDCAVSNSLNSGSWTRSSVWDIVFMTPCILGSSRPTFSPSIKMFGFISNNFWRYSSPVLMGFTIQYGEGVQVLNLNDARVCTRPALTYCELWTGLWLRFCESKSSHLLDRARVSVEKAGFTWRYSWTRLTRGSGRNSESTAVAPTSTWGRSLESVQTRRRSELRGSLMVGSYRDGSST